MSTFLGKVICKKPMLDDLSMLKMHSANKTGGCPEGERICGDRSKPYGIHYQKCIPYEYKCPINDIKIVAQTDEIRSKIVDKIQNESTDLWQYLKFNDEYAIGVSTS